MRSALLLLTVVSFVSLQVQAQDTFSILAFDSLTQEVGGAGASCLDLNQTPFSNDFIVELFPGEGAVATQAYYINFNQTTIRNRFQAGDSPAQMMAYMQANDYQQDPTLRQYGAVRLGTVYPRAAAHTGSNCTSYKNHIVGPNYTIHGNILLGQQVLDSMEARFNREKGDLACKLMAALQGANMVGADTRCTPNGTSSLFAFIKVAQPGDAFGQPSFLLSLRTADGAGREPIDSLQKLFDGVKSCVPPVATVIKKEQTGSSVQVYPNPAARELTISAKGQSGLVIIRDLRGRVVFSQQIREALTIATGSWEEGIYTLEFQGTVKKLSILR